MQGALIAFHYCAQSALWCYMHKMTIKMCLLLIQMNVYRALVTREQ